MSHFAGHIGPVGLGNRGQEGSAGLPLRTAGRGRHVDRHRTGQRDGAGCEDLGPSGGEHPAHVGVVDDPAFPGHWGCALLAIHRIGQRMLECRLGHPHTLRRY